MKLLLVLAVLIAVSCNKKDDSPISTSTPPTLGTYESCLDGNDGTSTYTTLLLSETGISATTVYYDSSACYASAKLFTETDIYSYTRNGTSFALQIESVVLTSLSTLASNAFNSKSLCGYTTWSNNSPKKITGRNCEGTTINVGDSSSLKLYKSNSNLIADDGEKKQSFKLVQALALDTQGTSLQNGTYIFYDGARGVHLTLTSPNFQMVLYDAASKRYYVKNGTYSSSSNLATFTTVSSTPSCTDSTAAPRKFQTNSLSMGLEGLTGETWLLEKVSWTTTQFRDNFLEAGYSQTCF